MATWNFSEVRPGDKTREPIQGEFFSNDSIGRSGEALVREGIQNALDAGVPGKIVHVRIFVSGPTFGVPADTHEEYFDSVLWKHLNASGNGLTDLPEPTAPCPFIVFEDFGTTGLEGDVEQYHPIAGKKNPFFHFIRAEGRSDKGEHERGRWGVGKFVFPRASMINTILCLSVRANDARRVLMGQTILKTHEVDARIFTPDGFFGELAGNGLTLPVEKTEITNDVCRSFCLDRGNDPGLSVVIPWHDPDINASALLAAVVRGFFYPVLAGNLTLTIETPDSSTELNADSFEDVVKQLSEEGGDELGVLCRLALHACQEADRIVADTPNQAHSVKWHPKMLTDVQKTTLANRLDHGKIVGVRIPLVVREKKGKSRESHFDLYIVKDDSQQSVRPVFVREGIIISDAQARRIRGYRVLVVIDDGPLATLLGDAENPSHTRWENGSNFKNKYLYGVSYISFVTGAAREVIASLSDAEQEMDRMLLSDFFFLPEQETDGKGTPGGRKKQGSKKSKPTPPPIPRSPPRYVITRQEGGFQIVGKPDTTPPGLIELKVAYDVRRGSPLKKYEPADFELGDGNVGVLDCEGATVLGQAANRLLLRIDSPGFRCSVAGFDKERDLYIDARAKASTDDN